MAQHQNSGVSGPSTHIITKQITASRNDKIAAKSPCYASAKGGGAFIMESKTMDEKTSANRIGEELNGGDDKEQL